MHYSSTKRSTILTYTIYLLWLSLAYEATARQLLASPAPAAPACGGLIPGCALASCPFSIVGTRSILTCPRCNGMLYLRSADSTRCGGCSAAAAVTVQHQPTRMQLAPHAIQLPNVQHSQCSWFCCFGGSVSLQQTPHMYSR